MVPGRIRKGAVIASAAGAAFLGGGPATENAAEFMNVADSIEQAETIDPSAYAATPRRPIAKTQTVCLSEGSHLFTSRARINSTSNGDFGITEERLSISAVVRAPRGKRIDYQIRQVIDEPEKSKDLKGKWFTSLNINGSQATISKGKCKPENLIDASSPDPKRDASTVFESLRDKNKIVNVQNKIAMLATGRKLGSQGCKINVSLDIDNKLLPYNPRWVLNFKNTEDAWTKSLLTGQTGDAADTELQPLPTTSLAVGKATRFVFKSPAGEPAYRGTSLVATVVFDNPTTGEEVAVSMGYKETGPELCDMYTTSQSPEEPESRDNGTGLEGLN